MSFLPRLVGKNIAALRDVKNFSRKDLSDLIEKMEVSRLGHLERGERNPTLGTLRRIAEALDAKLYALFSTEENCDFIGTYLMHSLPPYDKRLSTKEAFNMIGDSLFENLTLEMIEHAIDPIKSVSFRPMQRSIAVPGTCFLNKTYDLACTYAYWTGETTHQTIHDVSPDREEMQQLAALLHRMKPSEQHLTDIILDFIGSRSRDEA